MQTQVEFFEAHAVGGKLTPEQMMEMMTLPEGEIDGESIGAAPSTESDAEGQATDNTDEKTAEGEGANAVILAKDGVHTIPFEKLQEARDAAKQSRQALEAMQAQLEQARQQLEEARAQAQARADAGQAPTTQDKQLAAVEKALDAGVDPALFGDFSEEAIAKGVATLVAQRVEQELSKRLAPIAEREAKSAEEMHFNAIRTAHPDADSITESAELAQWRASKPSFMQASIDAVLQRGTSKEVIELFDAFKAETQKADAKAPNVGDLRAKALAKVQAAEQAAPLSLTGIPGSVQAAEDPTEALMKLDGAGLIDKFMGMSPDKVNQLISRMI